MNKSTLTIDFTDTIKWILEEIKKETFATKEDEYVYLPFQQSSDFPNIEDQRRALQFLEKENAIKIIRPKYPLNYIGNDTAELINLKPKGYYIDIIQPKFDKLFSQNHSKQSTIISNKKPLLFDTDKSIFYVQGEEIKLSKFKDEYQTLKIIFEDPKELGKEWFFSEIGEKLDFANSDDKKYYNAIYQLRTKLEKKNIKDFFITTSQSVKINPKYIS